MRELDNKNLGKTAVLLHCATSAAAWFWWLHGDDGVVAFSTNVCRPFALSAILCPLGSFRRSQGQQREQAYPCVQRIAGLENIYRFPSYIKIPVRLVHRTITFPIDLPRVLLFPLGTTRRLRRVVLKVNLFPTGGFLFEFMSYSI